MDDTNRICPWCSTPIPAAVKACPKCGAVVDDSVVADIPGLTVVDPKAGAKGDPIRKDMVRDIWSGASAAAATGDVEAVKPPSDAVRLEMLKMELAAQIENAGGEVMNPTGDESIDVGAPSPEAIAAYEAGLLDKTGPAGETDLGDLAAPWAEPETDSRAAGRRPEVDTANTPDDAK